MVEIKDLTMRFGKQLLFENVNLSLDKGRRYGLIGANGAGKSTLLKILSGQIEASSGEILIESGLKIGVLGQDQFAFESFSVKDAVLYGNKRLYDAVREKTQLYEAGEFNDEINERLGELEMICAEEDPAYEYETRIEKILSSLGLNDFDKKMSEIETSDKFKVLLAQVLFPRPDVLFLDEPTNNLDIDAISWLEFELNRHTGTLVVISHDRHFLDQVCTHTVDIDFGKVTLFSGNYSFWYESSQLALRQAQNQRQKAEEKRKELEEFIRRFSANVAKSKQTTSRKKMLEKLNVEEIKPSTRRYPGIIFQMEREPGNQILEVQDLKAVADDGTVLFNKVNFQVEKEEKVVFISHDPRAMTALFEIINGNQEAAAGTYSWGVTITTAYLPLDNTEFFDTDLNMLDWLSQYGEGNEVYFKAFLGRMLFSGEEILKSASVLSGGEKMRCMISRMMLRDANTLILDTPTNHLDLESIQAFNNTLVNYKGNVLFASHDHEFIQTIANRIIDITPEGVVDRVTTYDEFLENETVRQQLEEKYGKKS